MIGIIGALDLEIDNLRKQLSSPVSRTISGIQFTSGTYHGKDVVCAVCGIGKVFSALCAQTMILEYHPDLLVNTGVGGSLSPDLHLGDLAIGRCVVQHDMDSTTQGSPLGYVVGLDLIEIPCDPAASALLARQAQNLGIPHQTGCIVTGDQFIQSGEKKRFLADTFSGIACDMEGGSIGQVCYVNQVPFCVIRAVSDDADDAALGSFLTFAEMAASRSLSAVLGLLEQYN